MEYLNHGSFDAVMGVEIGGGNGILPLSIGSSKHFDRPVVDADWMGMYQSSFPFDISDIYCFLRRSGLPNILANNYMRISARRIGALLHPFRKWEHNYYEQVRK